MTSRAAMPTRTREQQRSGLFFHGNGGRKLGQAVVRHHLSPLFDPVVVKVHTTAGGLGPNKAVNAGVEEGRDQRDRQ